MKRRILIARIVWFCALLFVALGMSGMMFLACATSGCTPAREACTAIAVADSLCTVLVLTEADGGVTRVPVSAGELRETARRSQALWLLQVADGGTDAH